jgi:HEAT repeat protein
MMKSFWESLRRASPGWLPAIVLATAFPVRGATPEEPPAAATPTFEELRDQFAKDKTLEPFQRIPTIEKFARVRTKPAAEFLGKSYKEETNSGLCVVVTETLGKMGTEDAVKALIQEGMPYFLDPPHPPSATAEQIKSLKLEMAQLIEAERVALSNPLEPKAEEWLMKNGLTPLVRKDPKAMDIVLTAISRLKSPGRIPVLVNELSKATAPEVQVAVLGGLRANPAGKEDRVPAAAVHFLKSPNVDVQTAAYDLLSLTPDAKHRTHFVAGLKNPTWEIRVICLEALLALKDKDLVKHAAAFVKDPDPRVRVGAVQALLHHGGGEVIEPLFRSLGSAEGRLLDDIADALSRLTGKNFGTVQTQWESWWAQNKASGGNYTAMSAEEFAALKDQDTKQVTSATPLYFGLRVLSSNAAFVMDCSESMNEEYVPAKQEPAAGEKKEEKGKTVVVDPKNAGEKGAKKAKKKGVSRISIAKKELLEVVHRLRDGCSINILTFNSLITDFTAMAFPDLKEKGALPKVSPAVRDAAGAFVERAKAEGLTNLLTALNTAFSYPEIDTIYLLSDGAPTVGVVDPGELMARLERMNRHRKVKINCISFHPEPEERKLLRSLADLNYGVYVER